MAERALVSVDLSAIAHNVARLRKALSSTGQLMAVVKANAYGHGAVMVSRAALKAGAAQLAVTTLEEAQELRQAGITAPLLIFGPLDLDRTYQAAALECDVVVTRTSDIEQVLSKAPGTRLHVKVDTGMHRYGVAPEELPGIWKLFLAHRCRPAGFMTHFASADNPAHPLFARQLAHFKTLAEEARAHFPEVFIHAANSAATLRFPQAHFNGVRCGIALYGLSPFMESPLKDGLTPALSLTSYVAAQRRVAAGETVSYGPAFTTTHSLVVGTVPLGYGDGLHRLLSNTGMVLVGGKRCPIVGRICMDSFMVSLPAGEPLGPEEPVTVIGSQKEERIFAEELARAAQTINYEVTTALSSRVPRRFT